MLLPGVQSSDRRARGRRFRGRRLETAEEAKARLDVNRDGIIQSDECLCSDTVDFDFPELSMEDIDYSRLKPLETIAKAMAATVSAIDGSMPPEDEMRLLRNMLLQRPEDIVTTWLGYMPDAYAVAFNQSYNMTASAVRVDEQGCATTEAGCGGREHPQYELSEWYIPQLGRNATLHFPNVYADTCCIPTNYRDHLLTVEWGWLWNYISEDVDNFGDIVYTIRDYLHGNKSWHEAGAWGPPFVDPMIGAMVSYVTPMVTRVPIAGSFDPFVVSRTGGPSTGPHQSWEGLYVLGVAGIDVQLRDVILKCEAGLYSTYPVCSNCGAGSARRADQPAESCLVCSVGHYQAFSGQIECERCPTGRFADGVASQTCARCPLGRLAEESGASACHLCPSGTYLQRGSAESADANAVHIDSCEPCPAGASVSADGAGCQNCTVGLHSPEPSAATCKPCLSGTFAAEEGMTACKRCPAGSFANETQQAACWVCTPGRTTLDRILINGVLTMVPIEGAQGAARCLCEPGTRQESGVCVECGRGLSCHGGVDVRIDVGYYSDTDISVFQCHQNIHRCPGGQPGQTCAVGHMAISCAECEKGLVMGKRGECVPCAPGTKVALAVACLFCLGTLVLVYYFVATQDHTKQTHGTLVFVMSMSTLVTVLQQTAVVSSFNVRWPGPLSALFSAMRLFTFDFELLQVGCLVPTSPFSLFTFRITMIIDFVAAFVVIHLVFVMFGQGKARIAGPNCWRQSFQELRQKQPVLNAVVGTSFMTFYISVVSLISGPFQCLPNPNGLWTMRMYPSIICWEDTHWSIVAISVLASILPISYLVWCIYATRVFRRRVLKGDTYFFKSFAFLFFRYKAHRYWFALVHMSRSIALALIPILPNPPVQILLMQGVLISSIIATMFLQPWRVDFANWVETLFSVIVLMMVSFAAFFIEDDVTESIVWLAVASVLGSIVFAIVAGFHGLITHWTHKWRRPFGFFLCHHKLGAGACARLLKTDLIRAGVRKKVFIDNDHLLDLDLLFEHVQQTDVLVVLCSADVLKRPWCVGEVATALGAGVQINKVVLPGYLSPSDEFIEDYGKLVPDMQGLAERGITLAHVQGTLRDFRDKPIPTITLTGELGRRSVAQAAELLNGGCSGDETVAGAADNEQTQVDNKANLVIVDRYHLEAAATAIVLVTFLHPLLQHSPEHIPELLPLDATLPHSTSLVIILCWTGMFTQHGVVDSLIQAVVRECSFVPVFGEASFCTPTPETLMSSSLPPISGYSNEALMAAISTIFVSIAVTFQPNMYGTNEGALRAKASELSERLHNPGSLKRFSKQVLRATICRARI